MNRKNWIHEYKKNDIKKNNNNEFNIANQNQTKPNQT